jgi:hypothetical protein
MLVLRLSLEYNAAAERRSARAAGSPEPRSLTLHSVADTSELMTVPLQEHRLFQPLIDAP